MSTLRVGAASLNQIPLAWDHNRNQIIKVINEARSLGVAILCCPELCITGYGCEDTFLSKSTLTKALQMLNEIVPHTKGIAVSVGLPLLYKKNIYNTACLIVDGVIQGFSAKQNLARSGVHYEPRWFTPWPSGEETNIEIEFHEGQTQLFPLGDLIFSLDIAQIPEAGKETNRETEKKSREEISNKKIKIGFEICEDAWVENRTGITLASRGVDLILNPSASHFAFGKSDFRKAFVCEGARRFGVGYVYANLLGNEAGRLIYDGDTIIATAEGLLACGPRFSFHDSVLTTAMIDLEHLKDFQIKNLQVKGSPNNGTSRPIQTQSQKPSSYYSPYYWEESPHLKEEEFTRAVALGLFDYLRKSKAQGFVLSLSGGADSSTCACLIYLMVQLAIQELGMGGFQQKLSAIETIASLSISDGEFKKKITQHLLFCLYQGTENNSLHTRRSAKELCAILNVSFAEIEIDHLIKAYCDALSPIIGRSLTWEKDNIALQNIQARVRSPSIWLLANLRKSLLICPSNRSEASVGYSTMDGDTSGGLCPLAGIDKNFIMHWLFWLQEVGIKGIGPLPILKEILKFPASAELKPLDLEQTDETDLMPYDWLDKIERWFVRDKLNPSEILTLLLEHYPEQDPLRLSAAVERFIKLWTQNQWKRERIAPSFHLDDESVDPKTWCRYPILSEGYSLELEEMKAKVRK